MFRTYSSDDDIEIASGNDLEIIGERHGVLREQGHGTLYPGGLIYESDSDYRKRIKATMPKKTYDFSGDAVRETTAPREKTAEELAKERKQQMTDFFFPYKNVRGCECGVWLIGYVESGPNHSSFCRLHRKDMGTW